MVSADQFFAKVSTEYGKAKDYEAIVTITQGKSVSHGKLWYKSPMYLRIDFDTPAKQVLNFNGERLTVFLPTEEVTLEQWYKKKSPSHVEALVSSQGLALWQQNYSMAYLSGPALVPLEEGAKELVTKLKLTSRAATGYSMMIVSVKDNLVRRVEGTQSNGEKVVMDFTNIRTNQEVPVTRFDYDGPPDASVIKDWLFDSEQ